MSETFPRKTLTIKCSLKRLQCIIKFFLWENNNEPLRSTIYGRVLRGEEGKGQRFIKDNLSSNRIGVISIPNEHYLLLLRSPKNL